jgi:hypothetical protein
MTTQWRKLCRALPVLLTLFVTPLTVYAQRERSRIATIGGFHVGIPLAASVSAAAVFAGRERHWGGQPDGPFVGAELGALGISAHLGRINPFDGGALLGRVGALQWWGRGQNTYLGGEVRIVLMGSLGLGAYARVAGTRGPSFLPVLTMGFLY